jgi:integrase
MSIDYEQDRQCYRVRWREHGKQRSRRFRTEAEATAFLESFASPVAVAAPTESKAPNAPGVYSCETSGGVRWRFVFRQSDGTLTTRRGFSTRSEAIAARAAATEQVRRGEVRATRDTFRTFWTELLAAKRPYLTPGTLQDYTYHGRKRLLPWFGELRLTAIDEDRIRDWLADMAELVADGELSPKTVNNARTCLSMTLGEAVRRRYITQNPCQYVPALPVEKPEIDYLRVDEIERYLDACALHYRPLAEFLIGTGARISEALAIRWPDLDLEAGVVRILRQFGRAGASTTPTKGKRFRSVQIGPRLITTLRGVPPVRRTRLGFRGLAVS